MIIIGAGMAGLLAANYFRLLKPKVYERRSSLPRNHEALLRFRTDRVSRITGIEFSEVTVRSEVCWGDSFLPRVTIQAANRYAMKVSGSVSDRSIWNGIGEKKRFIPPPDFVDQLGMLVDVSYEVDWKHRNTSRDAGEPVISTMPIFALMKELEWKHIPKFEWQPIYVLNARLDNVADSVAQTIYFPSMTEAAYRASIMNGWLTVEMMIDPERAQLDHRGIVQSVLSVFGLDQSMVPPGKIRYHKQEFGKIIPTEEENCREFIYTATRDYNIYSLGRFALWRQILLDDVALDIEKIARMIRSNSKYAGVLEAMHSREKFIQTASRSRGHLGDLAHQAKD